MSANPSGHTGWVGGSVGLHFVTIGKFVCACVFINTHIHVYTYIHICVLKIFEGQEEEKQQL